MATLRTGQSRPCPAAYKKAAPLCDTALSC